MVTALSGTESNHDFGFFLLKQVEENSVAFRLKRDMRGGGGKKGEVMSIFN